MSAIISPSGPYRYRLERSIGGFLAGPTGAWIMANPSRTDFETDDATIRKLIGFSKRLGFGHIPRFPSETQPSAPPGPPRGSFFSRATFTRAQVGRSHQPT
jgi:hypothetical protein